MLKASKLQRSPLRFVLGAAVAFAPLLPLSALAAAAAGDARADGCPGGHHGPPPEAYAACDQKSDGAACSVTLRDHTLDGTCSAHGSDTRLSCRPNHPPGPPPEAFAACKDKAVAAACTVTFGSHTVDGTCEAAPRDGDAGAALACRPSGPPPGHD